jgi:hypothetical protein
MKRNPSFVPVLLSVVLLMLSLASTLSRAQTGDTTYTFSQEFIPFSDSGQWVPCYLDITNRTSSPLTMSTTLTFDQAYWAFDTVKWQGYAFRSDSTILVPAHTSTPDLRVKVYYKHAAPDTTVDQMQLCAPRCSWINLTGRGNCAPPPEWALAGGYDSNGYNNLDHVVEPGKDYYHWYADPRTLSTPTDIQIDVVGEYSDRFRTSPPHRLGTTWDSVSFLGAPKSVVHDTIIFTLTNCLGSFVQRAPVTAYSHITNSHTIRITPKHDSLRVPFLDRATQQIIIRNTSGISFAVSELKTSDPRKFRLVSPSSFVVPAGDSSTIYVDVIDAVERDLTTNYETASLTGKVRGEVDEKLIADSNISVVISARVMVYTPPFVGAVPRLAHGERPYGLLLVVPHADYSIYYSNNDSEAYDFLVPYFDDPNFYMTTLPPLPGRAPAGALIIGTTGFRGNTSVNTRTQLHWPRIRVRDGLRDTVTMDVLAVGDQGSLAVQASHATPDALLHPNPTSSYIRFSDELAAPVSIEVIDILGHVCLRAESSGTLDVRSLPNGSYLLHDARGFHRFTVVHQ